ncbi:MAG TPA: helix-turn-helix transcriptional regulator [Sedimentisphaerales bacterium]|nr:helix-turn-helix transcriptional regulator [Sedimentisphaerales bacterium]
MCSLSQSENEDREREKGPDESFYERPHTVLLNEKQWLYIQKRYNMSPRELEVARLVCEGLTNEEMADKLRVRPGTVKTHLRSIFNKSRVRNKISMLLRFVDDAGRLLPEVAVVPPISIVEAQKPVQKAPAPDEIVEKE